MAKIVLSICIPTYNRADLLTEALDKWVYEIQSNFLEQTVEVVVGDNCSGDNTEEVLKKYAKKYPFVRYYRNPENQGFKNNIVRLMYEAKGVYLWTIGDDDFIYKDHLKKVWVKMQEYQPDLAYLNYDAKVLDQGVTIKNMLNLSQDHFFPKRADFFHFFKSPDTIYRLRSTYFTFMSLYIVKKEIVLKNYEQVKDKVDLQKQHFPHAWILWFNLPDKILLLHQVMFVQYFSHAGHSTHTSGRFDTAIKFRRALAPFYDFLLKKYHQETGWLFKAYAYAGKLYSYLTITFSYLLVLKAKATN